MKIKKRAHALARLHEEVFGPAPGRPRPPDSPTPPCGPLALGDAELIDRAMAAANGGKFRRLWGGDTSGYRFEGNDGRSEADLALCGLLAFWTGPDPLRIDALFRRSGLMRPKWDARRGERTYGELTIAEALRGLRSFYGRLEGSIRRIWIGPSPAPHPNAPGTLPETSEGASHITVEVA